MIWGTGILEFLIICLHKKILYLFCTKGRS